MLARIFRDDSVVKSGLYLFVTICVAIGKALIERRHEAQA